MTTPILAGQKLRASDLNDALPLFAYATVATSRTSSTTLLDADGLALALAASSTYIVDGYLAYTAPDGGDFKAAWTIPSGATGHWTLFGLGTATTGSIGDISAYRRTSFTTAISLGGSDSFSSLLVALPRAYIVTTNAGTLQMQFAQDSSSGTATTVDIGSWLRAQKVS